MNFTSIKAFAVAAALPATMAMADGSAVKRSTISGGISPAGTLSAGPSRDRISTRSNQHHPPASGTASAERAGSQDGMAR